MKLKYSWILILVLMMGCSSAIQVRKYPVQVHAEKGSVVILNITVEADVKKKDEVKQETTANRDAGGL